MTDHKAKPPVLAWGRTPGNVNVPVQVDASGVVQVSSSGGGGGAVTIADGADVAEGATTDVKVTGDNTGTVSAKLRGLSTILNDMWDSVNHWLKVSIQNATLAVTQSGAWAVAISAGSALIGHVITDSGSTTAVTGNVATTVADAANVAFGAKADAKSTATDTTPITAMSVWKQISASIQLLVTGTIVTGNIADNAVDSGNPVKIGQRAISFGANPTEGSAADRMDWLTTIAGIPFVLQGHPNIITRRDTFTLAQTDTKLITVAGGTKIVVVSCTIVVGASATAKPAVRAGFAATTTPTGAGVYISHPGLAAGSGIAERTLTPGSDGDDFIFTCTVPTGDSIDVVTKYFTISS